MPGPWWCADVAEDLAASASAIGERPDEQAMAIGDRERNVDLLAEDQRALVRTSRWAARARAQRQ
jgi:hypothetical protein